MQSGQTPEGVEQRRTGRRISVDFPAEFVVGESAAAPGVASDLSVTGVWIEAQTGSLNVEELVKMRFSILPGNVRHRVCTTNRSQDYRWLRGSIPRSRSAPSPNPARGVLSIRCAIPPARRPMENG